jgi:aspartyl-tRNA(Asn)/glutamyl-tRNA(Gln) amidotransferase subunit B
MNRYHLVLGLEIHLHLRTAKKVFCGCYASFYGDSPNTHVCPTCLGLPGALPVVNYEAVEKTQLLGMALKCKLNSFSRFDRKHYFYPDLPKGYQISQYKYPLCEGGEVEIEDGSIFQLERIHLEEDTAKSFHKDGNTLIDFNKSGSPLVEIVTKPVFENAIDAVNFAKKIQDIIKILDIADVDMEKGQMRLEANISVRTKEMKDAGILPNYKVEVKNINSFKFMEKAIKYEFERQSQIIESGGMVEQENRGFNEKNGSTIPQRKKEKASDYKYFPEPDLPPMEFTNEYFEELVNKLPELPDQIFERLQNEYKLSKSSSRFFSSGDGITLLDKFENLSKNLDPTKVANTLINKPETRALEPEEFELVVRPIQTAILSEERIAEAIETVLTKEVDAVLKLQNGKDQVMMYLVGKVFQELKTKVPTDKIIQIINQKIKK